MLIVIQLQSHSKFYALFHRKMREAHNSFRTSFLLHSLNPVFLEIYRAHSTDSSIVYRFSPEAQDFFNDIMRAYQISNWNQLEVHRSTWQALFVFTPILICLGADPWAHGRADFHSSGNFFGHHNERQTTPGSYNEAE